MIVAICTLQYLALHKWCEGIPSVQSNLLFIARISMLSYVSKRSIFVSLIAILAIVLLATSIQARGAGASSTSWGISGRTAGLLDASLPPVNFQLLGTYDTGY